jgi:hypothetical protein
LLEAPLNLAPSLLTDDSTLQTETRYSSNREVCAGRYGSALLESVGRFFVVSISVVILKMEADF